MDLVRNRLDKLVFYAHFFGDEYEFSEIFEFVCEVAGFDSEMFFAGHLKGGGFYYNSRDLGLDVKLKKNKLTLEFQSLFFINDNAFDLIRLLFVELSIKINLQCSLSEMHVAKDFKNILPSDFFKGGFDNPKYQKSFKAIYQPFVGTEELETFYIKGTKSRWTIAVYNKTQELKSNRSKLSEFKYQYYKKMGYTDEEITRVEIKINAELCRTFFDPFLQSSNEYEFINQVTANFFFRRKIYLLKKGQIWDQRNSSRYNKYDLWEKIASTESKKENFNNSNSLHHLETLTKKQIVNRMANYFARYTGKITDELIKEVLTKANKKKNDRFRRKEETTLRYKKAISKFLKNRKGSINIFLKKDGKFISNTKENSSWPIKKQKK